MIPIYIYMQVTWIEVIQNTSAQAKAYVKTDNKGRIFTIDRGVNYPAYLTVC